MIACSDGTITDKKTGLTWQRRSYAETRLNWKQALIYCTNLKLGYFDDWRMPTVQELLTIVDYTESHPAIELLYFPDTIPSVYWSSTTVARYGNYAWGVYFGSGGTSSYSKNSKYYARAVRGGPRLFDNKCKCSASPADEITESSLIQEWA